MVASALPIEDAGSKGWRYNGKAVSAAVAISRADQLRSDQMIGGAAESSSPGRSDRGMQCSVSLDPAEWLSKPLN
jgi:hypothetical protein